ncbi:MAG: hypothetical protein IPG63_13500 [Xanthomonadales bacterium]|nr:hypothetical protein [Xanthomonadales bacterium]MBK7146428.1 hypothetical protein [Xanthomonadales bacterium]
MTICPVAIAVGCKRCPVFAVCPAKSIIGDQPAPPEAAPAAPAKPAAKRAARKRKR